MAPTGGVATPGAPCVAGLPPGNAELSTNNLEILRRASSAGHKIGSRSPAGHPARKGDGAPGIVRYASGDLGGSVGRDLAHHLILESWAAPHIEMTGWGRGSHRQGRACGERSAQKRSKANHYVRAAHDGSPLHQVVFG